MIKEQLLPKLAEDRVYPDHIYEPIRREIAEMFIEKEFLKLFPGISEAERAKMRSNTEGWYKGHGYELAPIHDFWNAAEGIIDGFKLKHLVRFLTAENITWQQEEIPTDSLTLWAHLPGLMADAGEPPYSAEQLRTLLKNPAIRQRQLEDDEKHSQPPRDHYPIIAMRKGAALNLLDGNRRLRQAVLYNKPTMRAYVGAYKNEPFEPQNYWVSTPSIRNLLFLLNETPKVEQLAVERAVYTILHRWFAVSAVARVNFDRATATKFQHRSYLRSDKLHEH